MNPSCFPDHLNVWAKSALDGEDRGESLAEHTWNVLARLSDLVHVRHQLADYLNIPNLWHCLYWACFLHDLGKSARGFQDMVRKGIRWGQRHEVLSLAFLDWIAPALSETECSWILAAIVSHHRDAKYIAEKYDEEMDPDPVAGMLAELDETTVRGLWQWLSTCGAAWIEDLDLRSFGVHMLPLVPEEQALRLTCEEGRQRIHMWLEHYRMFVRKLSSERDLRIVSTLISLRGMTTTADHMASAHLTEVPRGVQYSWEGLAQKCFGSVEETHTHQRSSAAQHDTSAMLVAPTGSGKTEASLFWAVGNGLQAVPRIFYTLPYQASMNAMYDRLRLPQYFGKESVGLQHGRALHALYQRMIDGERGPKTVAQEAAWRQNLTTLHAYPVKVFSPYQMLKTVYQIKGFEGMLTDYAQAAFIFDEIHAYDPARLAIILCLVKYLREHFGARFFIMSATFPRVLQTILIDILKVNEPIVAEKNLFEQFQRHYLRLLDGDLVKEGIESIVADVRQGKSVLVCCNTVHRAQYVQDVLSNLLSAEQVELIHSRLTFGDRLKREDTIRERCKIRRKYEQGEALALVATQVVEVSLNIDLDTIYTDPAPLDALIQRFGRVNRACQKEIVPVHVFRRPNNGQYVYNDYMVQKTLDVLEKHKNQNIDEAAVSDWLNEIYEDERIYQTWMKEYQNQYKLVTQLLNKLRPFNSNEESEQAFEKLFDGVEVLPACYEEQYLHFMRQDKFLEASHFLVSIKQKKSEQLMKKGKLRYLEHGKQKIPVVMLPYHPVRGLLFDASLSEIPDYD